jgi:hypothetical protein
MSDDLDEEPNEDPTPKQLRDAAKRGKEAEARAEAAERKLAFADAGLDLADERSQYFIDGYKGPMTREDIRGTAEPTCPNSRTPRCGNIGIRTGSRWKSRSSSTGWAAKCLSTVNRSFLRSIEVTAHLKGVSSLG